MSHGKHRTSVSNAQQHDETRLPPSPGKSASRRSSVTDISGRTTPDKSQHQSRSPTPVRSPSHKGNGHDSNTDSKPTLLVNEPATTRFHNLWVRSMTTLLMVGGFIAVILAGHSKVIFLVAFVQTLVYREVISIAAVTPREKKLPWMRAINWYFLISTNYFLYGESIIHYFRNTIYTPAYWTLLGPLAKHHRFISFALYCGGFVWFVMNLRTHHYKFQIQAFGWTHMTLLLVVVQSHFIINNILEGLIWFVLPVSLVIVNDIAAYVCGFLWGRTPLISLSPKKTWEGFIGAFIITFIFGFWFSGYLTQFGYLVCPARDLQTTSLSGLNCTRNSVFLEHSWVLSETAVGALDMVYSKLGRETPTVISYYPVQLHTVMLSCFASLIAPFGGFFASGVKRAFKIKDFGDSIPGHGGITDRMDCQFLMGLFSYMYYQSFISPSSITVGAALRMIATLKPHQQIRIYQELGAQLTARGLLQ
ncbi:phosphatidate cytidylyltransferase [Synchytrium microbalum]|uniref:Phosphatidate cytidylyltransferase n=1 Tax=Synchytrium microbalum TaxID=1806994 RepID=A0A507BSS3_9FUNG|nr:phosphatidate cytidylyltransferase [Synchytrium microbalum]TPX32650.1 phosphatidate cytidylyltransferase [Synchytrium microbalum]